MNQLDPSTDQIISMVKWIATMFAGYATNRGWMSGDMTETAVGVVVSIALLAIGIWQHSTRQKLKAVAAINPGIVITVPAAASASNSALAKVVNDNAVPQVKAA